MGDTTAQWGHCAIALVCRISLPVTTMMRWIFWSLSRTTMAGNPKAQGKAKKINQELRLGNIIMRSCKQEI
jgi:hypothetical protein